MRTWYAGNVENIEEDIITALYIHQTGDKFFWQVAQDRHSLLMVEIMCKIKDPSQPISTRYFSI